MIACYDPARKLFEFCDASRFSPINCAPHFVTREPASPRYMHTYGHSPFAPLMKTGVGTFFETIVMHQSVVTNKRLGFMISPAPYDKAMTLIKSDHKVVTGVIIRVIINS